MSYSASQNFFLCVADNLSSARSHPSFHSQMITRMEIWMWKHFNISKQIWLRTACQWILWPHLQSVITPAGLSNSPRCCLGDCKSPLPYWSCVCVCVSAPTYTVSGPQNSSWRRTRGFSRRSNASRWNRHRGHSSLQM